MPRSKPKSNRKPDAQGDSLYTPYYAVEPILPYLPPNSVIWEPAAGEGHLADALRFNGHTVIAGDITSGENYFDDRSVPPDYDFQVSNPPYSIKYHWLKRAYALDRPFALLLPGDTLLSQSAQKLFKRYGYQMLLPDQRIDYKTVKKGWTGDSQFTSAWFCWKLTGLANGITFVKLNKPPKAWVRNATDEMMRKPYVTETTESMFLMLEILLRLFYYCYWNWRSENDFESYFSG